MSNCGHDTAAYALGALEPAEAGAFRRHLETCAVCREELAALEQVVNAIPVAAPQYETPAALKRRVMRAVKAERKLSVARTPDRTRAWLPRPALAGALGLVAALAVAGGIELSSSGTQSQLLQAQVGKAQLRISQGRADLIVRHLPAPARGRIYELWLQHGTAEPVPSTLFSVTSAGTADIGIPVKLLQGWRVMVTDEPEAGSAAPTTKPVVVVSS